MVQILYYSLSCKVRSELKFNPQFPNVYTKVIKKAVSGWDDDDEIAVKFIYHITLTYLLFMFQTIETRSCKLIWHLTTIVISPSHVYRLVIDVESWTFWLWFKNDSFSTTDCRGWRPTTLIQYGMPCVGVMVGGKRRVLFTLARLCHAHYYWYVSFACSCSIW